MGLQRWGIAVSSGMVSFEGRLFLRGNGSLVVGLCPSHVDDTPLPEVSTCYSSVRLSGSVTWAERNFTLNSHATDLNASLVLWLDGGIGDTIGVDDVLLEPSKANRWRGQHVRADMAEAMLMDGALDFIRFGGDMANANSYDWRGMRGPAGLRPPRMAGSWDPVASNGESVDTSTVCIVVL